MTQPQRVTREQVIEAPTTQLVLPKGMVGKLSSSTTPDVRNVEHWKGTNTGAVSVTNFLNGQPAQHLYIEGDGFTTLVHNTTIRLTGGVNLLLLTDKIYHLIYRDGRWIQVL